MHKRSECRVSHEANILTLRIGMVSTLPKGSSTVSEHTNLLPDLTSRNDIFDYLDGHAVTTAEGLEQRHLPGGLVKTLMMETVPTDVILPPLADVLRRSGFRITWVDDEVGLVSSAAFGDRPFAVLEAMAQRHPVLYTLIRSEDAGRVLEPLVRTNPWLDRLWISAPIFERLWDRVRATSHPNRYTRLKFDHDAFFEVPEDPTAEIGTDDAADDWEIATGAHGGEEGDEREGRRTSTFTIVDRVSTIDEKLPKLRETYRPLESLVQLRVPAPGRGGHDFYYDGRVTNRSDSFYDHRAQVRQVVETYRRATDASEAALWLPGDHDGARFHGSALTLRFSEPLSGPTFERWLDSTFTRHGRFRLSGRVFRTGPTRAQIAAIDRHLWQTLQMEVSARGITALLPTGTCGNTVHRLVTNIQRYLDPAVQAWVGETSYDELVSAAFSDAA